MKRHSDRNTWLYGGIIERVPWEADENGLVYLWGGGTDTVEKGDKVLLLRTGALFVLIVGVERRAVAA